MKRCEYKQTSEALFYSALRRKLEIAYFGSCSVRESRKEGPILTFQKEIGDGKQDFTASLGWLDRWKKRYGIRQLKM